MSEQSQAVVAASAATKSQEANGTASAVAGPSSRPMPSSVQLQDAINQLTHLQRVLVGDNNLSLDELLAATAAGGPASQSVPEGGLLHALPKMLAPLLPLGRSSDVQSHNNGGIQASQPHALGGDLTPQQTALLLARRAAFQPRQFIGMATDLVARSQKGLGQAAVALDLSTEVQDGGKASPTLRQRTLENRKRKREAVRQLGGPMTFADSIKAQQQLVDSSRSREKRRERQAPSLVEPEFVFAGQARARAGSSVHYGVLSSGRPSRKVLDTYLEDWYEQLETADVDAARAVCVDIESTFEAEDAVRATIRMDIAALGTAWIAMTFREKREGQSWHPRVEWLNIRAESEVRRTAQDVDHQLLLSSFPLYRRLTADLQVKAIGIETAPENSWYPMDATLFALAALVHLHEHEQPYAAVLGVASSGSAIATGTNPKGALAILDAIRRWSPNSTNETEQAGVPEQRGPQDEQSSDKSSNISDLASTSVTKDESGSKEVGYDSMKPIPGDTMMSEAEHQDGVVSEHAAANATTKAGAGSTETAEAGSGADATRPAADEVTQEM